MLAFAFVSGIGLVGAAWVFERFSRGTSTPSRAVTTGTGLGLALVRDHVRAWHSSSV